MNSKLKHVPTGQLFRDRIEAKAWLGIGSKKYDAKLRDGEIIKIQTTISQVNHYGTNTKSAL